ncbi:MAG: phage major capsid protein [Pseudomonadota bacterium]
MPSQQLTELRERQEQLVTEARSVFDQITDDTPDNEVSDLESRHDDIMAERDRVQARADRLERLEEAEAEREEREFLARDEERRNRRPTPPNGEADTESVSPDVSEVFRRYVSYGFAALDDEQRSVAGQFLSAQVPDAVLQDANEARSQGTVNDAAGGATIPELFLPDLTRAMEAYGPMLESEGGARFINTGGGNPLQWPTVDDTGNEGQQRAENTASPTDDSEDVAFGSKSLDAYVHRSGVIRVPIELFQDTGINLQQVLNDLLAERLGRSGNRALTVGTGADQPNGIVTASSAGTVAAANNSITYDEVIDLEHSVDPAYRNGPNVKYQLHDTTLQAIRKLKDGQGNYLWQEGNVRAGIPATMNGRRYSINQHMAELDSGGSSRVILFGDHSKYIVRRVQNISFIIMRERFAEFLQQGWLAWMRFDGELTDTRAIKHLALAP